MNRSASNRPDIHNVTLTKNRPLLPNSYTDWKKRFMNSEDVSWWQWTVILFQLKNIDAKIIYWLYKADMLLIKQWISIILHFVKSWKPNPGHHPKVFGNCYPKDCTDRTRFFGWIKIGPERMFSVSSRIRQIDVVNWIAFFIWVMQFLNRNKMILSSMGNLHLFLHHSRTCWPFGIFSYKIS